MAQMIWRENALESLTRILEFKLIYFKYVINGVEYVVIAELWDTRMNSEILQNNL